MRGILVHKEQIGEADELMTDFNLSPDHRVKRCLHWWLYVFNNQCSRDVAAVTARLTEFLPDASADQNSRNPKLLEDKATAALLAAMSQPKVGDLNLAEEAGMKAGYTALAKRGLIGLRNAASHQAWVTMKVERWLIARGLWTHDVIVTANVGVHRETVRDRAVSEAHAARKAAKMRKDIRTRYGLPARDPSLTFATVIRPMAKPMKLRLVVDVPFEVSDYYDPDGYDPDIGPILNLVGPDDSSNDDALGAYFWGLAKKADALREAARG